MRVIDSPSSWIYYTSIPPFLTVDENLSAVSAIHAIPDLVIGSQAIMVIMATVLGIIMQVVRI